ncbi:glutamine amidotransferase [Yoonia litorea]|uniref:GMP synthase (Glutamine-hydrolysing) n=1 Tax=Yoonia litorea TaxID=1123755 RepID=A0A1I6MWH8_9RHOB|nr:glutamine amidotransferase [Yoonia litorea]SFS19987.1 GMP synthase (glutamine-hydrolysing) [Yoonia litorea]
MKPFLILQLRPEKDASDDEYAAILNKCGLTADETVRVCLDREELPEDIDVRDYSGVIVGGGPGCISDAPDEKSEMDARIERQILGLMPQITKEDHPFMGCCYGLGILAHHLGGNVSKENYAEAVGPTLCTVIEGAEADPLLDGLENSFSAFVGHKEAVQSLPNGTVHLLGSESCPIQMLRFGQNVYATQFHPEADSDDFAKRIRVYRNHGYFPPEDADRLIEVCKAADVTVPGEILRRFTERYRT